MKKRKLLGDAIRERRIELGYSQEGFAQAHGIERARYGRIERGEANLTLDKVFELCELLEIAPSDLFRAIK